MKFSTAKAGKDRGVWHSRLYLASHTPRPMMAFVNRKRICEEHMPGKYNIEIIDLVESPAPARGDQIHAIPTLVRKLPEPIRKIIGDLSNTERVLVGSDLKACLTCPRSRLLESMPRKKNARPEASETKQVGKVIYLLRLYVSGATFRSSRAILNLKAFCENYLPGRYQLQVVDIYQQPALATQIIAAPTLIKHAPLPVRRFIGDLSLIGKLLQGLDLHRDMEDRIEDEDSEHDSAAAH